MVIPVPMLRLRAAAVSPPTRRNILRGIMVFRWLSFAWAAGVFSYEVYDRNVRSNLKTDVARPIAGLIIFAAVFLFLAVMTRSYWTKPDTAMRPFWIFGEIGLASLLFLSDVWVYGSPDHAQALPTVWPVAVIATVALAGGQGAAVITGFGMGVARYIGWLPYGESSLSLTRTSSLVLLMIAGWSAGYLFQRLEAADIEISGFRAREEVARTLHDGVLQTLAVIQRRSDDTELVQLARHQEQELRDYLFTGGAEPGDLATELRSAARSAEALHGFRVQVVCAPDLPTGTPGQTGAIVGAVTEALNNVGKHAGASTVVIYAEPDFDDDDVVFVSVKDDGVGFASDTPKTGQGLQRSIRDRIEEQGGRTEITSAAGRGTEVQVWL